MSLSACAVTASTSCVSSAILFCSFTSTATATLAPAFVTARLDYTAIQHTLYMYVGLSALHLRWLERGIRTCARLIRGIPRTGHVSAYMLDALVWKCWKCLWALFWTNSEIFAISPWAPEVAVPSDQWTTGGTLCPFCSYFNNARLVHSRCLVPLFGMDFQWHCDYSP